MKEECYGEMIYQRSSMIALRQSSKAIASISKNSRHEYVETDGFLCFRTWTEQATMASFVNQVKRSGPWTKQKLQKLQDGALLLLTVLETPHFLKKDMTISAVAQMFHKMFGTVLRTAGGATAAGGLATRRGRGKERGGKSEVRATKKRKIGSSKLNESGLGECTYPRCNIGGRTDSKCKNCRQIVRHMRSVVGRNLLKYIHNDTHIESYEEVACSIPCYKALSARHARLPKWKGAFDE